MDEGTRVWRWIGPRLLSTMGTTVTTATLVRLEALGDLQGCLGLEGLEEDIQDHSVSTSGHLKRKIRRRKRKTGHLKHSALAHYTGYRKDDMGRLHLLIRTLQFLRPSMRLSTNIRPITNSCLNSHLKPMYQSCSMARESPGGPGVLRSLWSLGFLGFLHIHRTHQIRIHQICTSGRPGILRTPWTLGIMAVGLGGSVRLDAVVDALGQIIISYRATCTTHAMLAMERRLDGPRRIAGPRLGAWTAGAFSWYAGRRYMVSRKPFWSACPRR
jgi:hypothetical protein